MGSSKVENKEPLLLRRKNIFLLLFFQLGMLAWGLYYFQYGEKIEVNKGLGWDGKLYAAIASDFENFVSKGTLDKFYYKRTLPSAIVYYGHKLLGVEFSITSIINAFFFMNLGLLIIGMLIWHEILHHFKISFWNRVLAFLGVFGSYAIVKVNFYYPVLTDTTALFLSLAMLWAYLKKHDWLVFLASVLGAFTFPTLFVMGAILLVFPKTHLSFEGKEDRYTRFAPWLIAITYLTFVGYLWFSNELFVEKKSVWAVLAILTNAAFLMFIGRQVPWGAFINSIRNINKKWLAITFFFFIGTAILVEVFARSEGQTVYYFMSHMMERTGFAPLLFDVAHVVYFGPIVLIFAILYRGFKEALYKQSTGIVIVIFAYLFFSIDPSSRQLIASLPFLLMVLVQMLEKVEVSKWFYLTFCGLTLLFSRFWFTINTGEFTGDTSQFPDQRYFMADGLYTTYEMYFLQGGIVLACGIMLWAIIRGTKYKVVS